MDMNDPGREPEPTDAELHRATLTRMLQCCGTWEDNARVIGDVRAGDAVAALVWALSGARPMPEKPNCPETPDSSADPMLGANQCEHGQLTRQCLTCELQARIADLERDLKTAAGDYPVEMSEPGTPMAILLSANVLLKRENAALGAELAALREGNKPPVYEHHPGWVCTKEAQAYFDKEADPGKEAPDA